MSVLDELKQQEDFTPTEQRISEYILNNQEKISKTSAKKLAEMVYSSHSAIVRLAQKLGFSGYKEFKIALIQEIQNSFHLTDDVDPRFPFTMDDNYSAIAKKMCDLAIESIKRSASHLSQEILEKAASILNNADRIFLFGIGDSQIRAKSFQNKCIKINRYPIIADEFGESSWHTLNITEKDCALIISYEANSIDLEKHIRYLNKKRVKIILLTGNTKAPVAKMSSLVIEVLQGEFGHRKVGTFSSQLSFEFVLDTLFALIYSNDYLHNFHTIEIKENIVNENFNTRHPTN